MKTATYLSATLLLVAGGTARAGTASFDAAMVPLAEQYLLIHTALADDHTGGVSAAADKIANLAGQLDTSRVTGDHADHYRKLPVTIAKLAKLVAKAGDLAGVREQFKELSKPFAMWGTMSQPAGFDVVYCSMARASWIQKSGPILNPYYGQSMLHCGEVVGGLEYAAKKESRH